MRSNPIGPLALVLGLALFTTACGSTGEGTGEASGDVRVIEHAGGTTEVPAEPERVATSSEVVAGHLMSAGLLPIAGPDGVAEWLQPYADAGLIGDVDLTSITEFYGAEPNFELLVTLEPDLILVEQWELEQYDLYAAIAPTVVISRPTNAEWKAGFDQSVAAAGIEDAAQPVRDRYEALTASVDPGVTDTLVTFLRGSGPGQFRIDALGGFGGSVAGEYGYSVDDGGATDGEADGGTITFSNEQLDVVMGDLLVTTIQETGGRSNIDELRASPLWEAIPAVSSGRIVELPQSIYNGGTYVAAELLLRALIDAG